MRLTLTAAVEVSEKYRAHVERMFNEFIDGLPDRVGGLEVVKASDDAEQVPPGHDESEGKGSGQPAGAGFPKLSH